MAKISITSDDGELYGVIELADYNLSTAYARLSLTNEIIQTMPQHERDKLNSLTKEDK